MAYGTPPGIAALAQMWTMGGVWVDPVAYDDGPPIVQAVVGTNPTLTQVRDWLESISAIMDLALSNVGFETPVDVPAAMAAISPYVESLVADLCHAANSSGRFYTEKVVERGLSPFVIVQQNIDGWVQTNIQGLKNLGVPFIGSDSSSPSFSVPTTRQL